MKRNHHTPQERCPLTSDALELFLETFSLSSVNVLRGLRWAEPHTFIIFHLPEKVKHNALCIEWTFQKLLTQ